MKLLLVIGFAVAFLGFMVVATGFNRALGINLFYVGFYLAVVGVVTTILRSKFPGKMGFGLKVGAVGFTIASLGGLVSIFGGSEQLATWIANFGILVFVVGTILGVFSSKRTNAVDIVDNVDSEED